MLVQKNFSDIITFARASARWRMGSAGLLVQDAINVPSLSFDPLTGAPRGLLVEATRTNIVTYSNDLSNALWTKTSCTAVLGAIVAPDGGGAYKLIESTGITTSKELRRPSINMVAGQPQTLSVFAKLSDTGARRRLKLALESNTVTTGSVAVTFDLLAGTVSSTIGATGSITAYPNGWYRCHMYVMPTVTTATAIYATLVDETNSANYAGDGVSGLYVWNCVCEVGSAQTSPIITGAATVTRSSDSAIITDLSKLSFNPSEGTLFIEAIAGAIRTDGGSTFVASFEDATVANFLAFGRTSGGVARFQIRANGADQGSIIVGNWTQNTVGKMACSWGAGGMSMSFNGANATSATMATVPANIGKLILGISNVDGSSWWNSIIRQFNYIPRKLTDAELKTMST